MNRMHFHFGSRVALIGTISAAGFASAALAQQPAAAPAKNDAPPNINMPSNTGGQKTRSAPSKGGTLPPGTIQALPTTPGVVVVPTGGTFNNNASEVSTSRSGPDAADPTPTATAGNAVPPSPPATPASVGTGANPGSFNSSPGLGPIQNTIIRSMRGNLLGTGFRLVDAGPPEVVFVSGSNGWMVGDTTLVPRRDVTLVADGIDIKLTYTNTTSAPLPVGVIQVSDIRLADRVEILDARHGIEHFDVFDRNVTPLKVNNNGWPGDLYSPVAVLRDEKYTVGVSLQYPALEYRHGVDFRVGDGTRWYGDGGPFWHVRIDVPATVPPGQSRIYTLSVRVAPRTDSWLKTLVPYRDYFQATYGGVRYERDARPVTAAIIAFEENASPGNNRGFAFPNLRPDLNGWRPWAREVTARRSLGYQRSLIWAAAGIYSQNGFKNYPSNSISPMDDIPMMRNSKSELANAASPSMQVGYWLGYSTCFETAWDSPTPQRLITLGNAEQEGYFFKELDFAASLNAGLIGLDAFTSNDPYFIYTWMTKLRQRQPNIKFISELSPPDIIHSLAGSFLFEWNVGENEKPLLADFLLPGHETWVSVWGMALTRELGRRPTMAEFVRSYQRYSDSGYTVLDVNAVPLPPTITAARTWETAIPAELRTPVGGPTTTPQAPTSSIGAPGSTEPSITPPPPGTNTRANGPQPQAGHAAPPTTGAQMLSGRRSRITVPPANQQATAPDR